MRDGRAEQIGSERDRKREVNPRTAMGQKC